METGNNSQNIENPLFLFPLFGVDIFVLKSDIQLDWIEKEFNQSNVKSKDIEPQTGSSLPEDVASVQVKKIPKQKIKIVNVFLDAIDSDLSDEALVAYEKLMINLKVNGNPIQFTEVAMVNFQNSTQLQSMAVNNGIQFSTDIVQEFETEYCVLWSDHPLSNPSMQHFSMINFNNYKLIYLPGFRSMLTSTEVKKNVWIAFKQLLGFV